MTHREMDMFDKPNISEISARSDLELVMKSHGVYCEGEKKRYFIHSQLFRFSPCSLPILVPPICFNKNEQCERLISEHSVEDVLFPHLDKLLRFPYNGVIVCDISDYPALYILSDRWGGEDICKRLAKSLRDQLTIDNCYDAFANIANVRMSGIMLPDRIRDPVISFITENLGRINNSCHIVQDVHISCCNLKLWREVINILEEGAINTRRSKFRLPLNIANIIPIVIKRFAEIRMQRVNINLSFLDFEPVNDDAYNEVAHKICQIQSNQVELEMERSITEILNTQQLVGLLPKNQESSIENITIHETNNTEPLESAKLRRLMVDTAVSFRDVHKISKETIANVIYKHYEPMCREDLDECMDNLNYLISDRFIPSITPELAFDIFKSVLCISQKKGTNFERELLNLPCRGKCEKVLSRKPQEIILETFGPNIAVPIFMNCIERLQTKTQSLSENLCRLEERKTYLSQRLFFSKIDSIVIECKRLSCIGGIYRVHGWDDNGPIYSNNRIYNVNELNHDFILVLSKTPKDDILEGDRLPSTPVSAIRQISGMRHFVRFSENEIRRPPIVYPKVTSHSAHSDIVDDRKRKFQDSETKTRKSTRISCKNNNQVFESPFRWCLQFVKVTVGVQMHSTRIPLFYTSDNNLSTPPCDGRIWCLASQWLSNRKSTGNNVVGIDDSSLGLMCYLQTGPGHGSTGIMEN
jgi:hypothetical protein